MERMSQERKPAADETCEITKTYEFLLLNAKTTKLRKKILAVGLEHMETRKTQLKGALDPCDEEALDSFTAELKKMEKAL
jgi:hypothetical protein